MEDEAIKKYIKSKELSEKQNYNDALVYLDEAIKLKPDYKEAYNEKGKLLLTIGKESDAIRNFIFATMIDPDYKDAWTNMEAAHLIKSKYENAIRAIDQILRIDPIDKNAYVRKAKILIDINEEKDAYVCLCRAIEIDPLIKSTFSEKEHILLEKFSNVVQKRVKEIRKKICLLGDKAVGKTSLIRRFVYDAFDDRYLATIGAKITKKNIKITNLDKNIDFVIDFVIWDIAGHEKFNEVRKIYYEGTAGVLLVCDITRKDTIENILNWADAVFKVTGKIPVVCIGNKIDLEHETFFRR